MNSAQRLYELLSNAVTKADDTRTRDVWAEILEISPDYGDHKLIAKVSSSLAALHQEVESLHVAMMETEIPKEVFEPPLRQVEAAISATNLDAPWQYFKKSITPDVLLALRYNSAILGLKEHPLDEEELASLLADLAELEGKLAESSLSPSVRALVDRQILSIRDALGAYKVKGATAIKDAVHKAAGELIENKEQIAAYRDNEVVGLLGQLWMRLTQLGDSLVKVDKALESGKKLWELIEPVFRSS